jgi:N-acetylglucosamine kinase-like BadF-type ATPase
MPVDEIVLGIDGGGSSTRARAVTGDCLVFERTVGSTNPKTVPPVAVADRLTLLLNGCPSPRAVAACISGMRSAETRSLFRQCLSDRFPSADIRLEPDFAAALRLFESPIAICVIAGTGSIVCSRSDDGETRTSGGEGYLLGDHGSAFRLGQRLVSDYATDPASVGTLGPEMDAALGVDRTRLVATVHDSLEPASLIARAAPVLTHAADDGVAWAQRLVDAEMDLLASLVVLHRERHSLAGPLSVGLAGGVWDSSYVRCSFGLALERHAGTDVQLLRARRSPVEGAAELAREML